MKRKIKILVMAIALVLMIPSQAKAQGMPVYDNTNFVSLVKSLIESAKQTSQLVKSVKFLKEAKESIEKVNNVIQQLKAVEHIGQNHAELFSVMQSDLNNILSSPYIKVEEVDQITNSFNAIVENSLDTVDFISEILSSDNLKMTDGERAKVLKDKEQESAQMVSDINRKTKRYRGIISFRKMQDKINNRETDY
ncbi:hypothetical protein [Lacinutrix algicola]|uniref:hypothetical protein n=1 Tax=Lacinutrix algicola TaxID=342954 RepID=UPI0006E189FD|nr:hypothetical protein [Lacinutrix algicola]